MSEGIPSLNISVKKPGQIAVVIHYCNLSRFFWLGRYVVKRCKSENHTTEICGNQGPSVLFSNFPESDYLELVVEGSRQCKRRSSKNIEQQYDPWMPLCRQFQQSRLMTPGLVFHFKRQAYKYKALFDADIRPFRSGKNNTKLENFLPFCLKDPGFWLMYLEWFFFYKWIIEVI